MSVKQAEENCKERQVRCDQTAEWGAGTGQGGNTSLSGAQHMDCHSLTHRKTADNLRKEELQGDYVPGWLPLGVNLIK